MKGPLSPNATGARKYALHPAFDPDLNGLVAAEEAIAVELEHADPVETRLVGLQDQVLELRGLLAAQQDLLKRLVDLLAGEGR